MTNINEDQNINRRIRNDLTQYMIPIIPAAENKGASTMNPDVLRAWGLSTVTAAGRIVIRPAR
jgi:hypothetical protein